MQKHHKTIDDGLYFYTECLQPCKYIKVYQTIGYVDKY